MSPRLGNKWKFNPNIQGFPQTVGCSSGFTIYLLTENFYTYFWPISSPAVLDLLIHRRSPTRFGAEACLIPFWGKSYSAENPLNDQKKGTPIEELDASKHSSEILMGKFWTLQTLCFEVRTGRWGSEPIKTADKWWKDQLPSGRLSNLWKEKEGESREAEAKHKNQTSGRLVREACFRTVGFLLMQGNNVTLY